MDIIVSAAPATSSRELIPADTYVARCVEMIQIGTVQKTFEGKSKEVPQVRLTWELPDHLQEYDGKQEPARISQNYTLSLHEKAGLRKTLKSWRGRDFTEEELAGFSLKNLLGAPCMLTVSHTEKGEKTYANVETVSKLMKNMQCPPQAHPSKILAYGEDFDWTVYEALPDFLKKMMQPTPEFIRQEKARKAAPKPAQPEPVLAEVGDDALPF